jgi:hypothetical protein
MKERSNESKTAAALARLFQISSIVIVIVVAVAAITALAGGNVTVWLDAAGFPSIEAGPGARMAIPISGTLTVGESSPVASIHGLLKFDGGPAALRVTNTVIVFVLLAGAFWVLREFSSIFRALRGRQFFLPSNAARVRRVGWAVIGAEMVRAAIVCFESSYAARHFTVEGLRLESHFELNVFAIVCGAMILVLAEVFREGLRLHEEASLTI